MLMGDQVESYGKHVEFNAQVIEEHRVNNVCSTDSRADIPAERPREVMTALKYGIFLNARKAQLILSNKVIEEEA